MSRRGIKHDISPAADLFVGRWTQKMPLTMDNSVAVSRQLGTRTNLQVIDNLANINCGHRNTIISTINKLSLTPTATTHLLGAIGVSVLSTGFENLGFELVAESFYKVCSSAISKSRLADRGTPQSVYVAALPN